MGDSARIKSFAQRVKLRGERPPQGILRRASSNSSSNCLLFTMDSKAMRKVGAQDDIAITIEDRLFGLEVAMEGRMLIKLH